MQRRLRPILPWCVLAALAAIEPSCGGNPASPQAPAPLCNKPPRPTPVAPPGADFPCPTAADLDALELDVAVTFEGGSLEGDLVCRAIDGSRDLTHVQKDVYQTLLFMKRLRFDAPLPWTDRSLYDWFRLSVGGVRIRTDIATNGCCSPARVINLIGVPTLAITRWPYLEMMVHEARHTGGMGHTCGTRDNTIAELGSYGVQYYAMLWLGSHWPEGTSAEREYALNRAALLRAGPFCQECE